MEEKQQNDTDVLDGTDFSQFLLFNVSENIFGIQINYVQEVVDMDCIFHVPLMSDVISGVINLRGVIVPVIDLCMRFYDVQMDKEASPKIIIIEMENEGDIIQIGMLVNSVISVINIAPGIIKPAPDFGTNIRSDFISNTVTINDDFILLVDIHKILDIDEISDIKMNTGDINKITSADMISIDDPVQEKSTADEYEETEENNFITFSIDNETYGFPTRRLHQIVIPREIIPIPNTLPFMKGIINLQGTAIPLVDLRIRCNLKKKNNETAAWVFIIEIKGILVGLITETASDLVSIDRNSIQHTLHYSAAIDSDYVIGIAENKGRLIILLDVDRILTNEEVDRISMLKDNKINI